MLLCLVLGLYLVYLSIIPRAHLHLIAKMDASEEASGKVDLTLVFYLQGAFLHICRQKSLFDLENEQYVLSVFYLGKT